MTRRNTEADMQTSDLEGINRSGAIARSRGESFHANPHYMGTWKTMDEMMQWHRVASAWASGWLKEDRGRDAAIAGLQRVAFW
jgi:hypothetical protein